MKTLVLFTFLLCCSTLGFSQAAKDDQLVIEMQFNKTRKDLIKEYLSLSAEKEVAFWKVYDEYEIKRKDLGIDRLLIINDYIKTYEQLTNEQAKSFAYRIMVNDESITALQKEFFPKFMKAVGAKDSAKFYQLENYFQTIIRMDLQDQIPFIDELNKKHQSSD